MEMAWKEGHFFFKRFRSFIFLGFPTVCVLSVFFSPDFLFFYVFLLLVAFLRFCFLSLFCFVGFLLSLPFKLCFPLLPDLLLSRFFASLLYLFFCVVASLSVCFFACLILLLLCFFLQSLLFCFSFVGEFVHSLLLLHGLLASVRLLLLPLRCVGTNIH